MSMELLEATEESKSAPSEPERIVCEIPEGKVGFALARISPGAEGADAPAAHADRVIIEKINLENAITARLPTVGSWGQNAQ